MYMSSRYSGNLGWDVNGNETIAYASNEEAYIAFQINLDDNPVIEIELSQVATVRLVQMLLAAMEGTLST